MKEKRKIGIVVALVVILCVGTIAWQNLKERNASSPGIAPPLIGMNLEEGENNYALTIYRIDSVAGEIWRCNPSADHWLSSLDPVSFLLYNFSAVLEDPTINIKDILINQTDENNIASGSVKNALNNTDGLVTYYDTDDDGKLSVNDTFVINDKYDAFRVGNKFMVNGTVTENTQGMVVAFTLIYHGNVDSFFSEEYAESHFWDISSVFVPSNEVSI